MIFHLSFLQEIVDTIDHYIEKKKYVFLKSVEDDQKAKIDAKIEETIRQCGNLYYPKKGDDIDEAMGRIINNRPNDQQLKIMFIRVSEGVYKFGEKRFTISFDKNGQPVARIGGGFLPIDEFIKIYTPKELSKLQPRDATTRFHNKLQNLKI